MTASTLLAVPEQASLQPAPARFPASSPCILSVAYLRAFVTLLVLAPLAAGLDWFRWSPWGPYWFQNSRALHPLVYLVLGIAIGAYGRERGFLARDGKLRLRWWLWCVASLAALAVGTGVGTAAMTVHQGSSAWEIAGDSTFVLASAASSFAFVALLVRFAGKRRPIFDRLNENAYGIYLLHYAFVSWAQLALLKLELPAMAKAPVVFVGAGLLSWGTVALMGGIPRGQLARRGA